MVDNLTPLERTAITVSRNDPPWSLVRQSAFARWARGRFGPLPFANEQLEALRVYVVLSQRDAGKLNSQQIALLSDLTLGGETKYEIDQFLACTSPVQALRRRSHERAAAGPWHIPQSHGPANPKPFHISVSRDCFRSLRP